MAQVKIEVGAIRFAVNGGAEVIAQEREAFTDFLKHKMGEDILAAQQRRRKAQPFHREPDDTMNARRVLNCNITPWLLKSAIEEGHLDRIIRPFDEIDIPLDTGGTVTAVCGYSDSCSARFVFKDCWDEAVMNEEATNKGGYFKSKGRAHVLVDVLPPYRAGVAGHLQAAPAFGDHRRRNGGVRRPPLAPLCHRYVRPLGGGLLERHRRQFPARNLQAGARPGERVRGQRDVPLLAPLRRCGGHDVLWARRYRRRPQLRQRLLLGWVCAGL